ncbi:MAG: DUF4124 domain-containing protein [Burkholderiaceae bacterium]|nr:DUF4124 domain-containing protein [Burkholderiaceae bacterium]
MFQRHAAVLAAVTALAVVPATAFAGMYKCVGADGATTFSDKACPVNDGQTQAAISKDSALSSSMTRYHDRELGQSCSDMSDRSRRCGIPINRTIQTHFQESCYGPQHRYEIEHNKDLAVQRRGQPVDWDHDPRYHQKTSAELKCGVLVTDMWQFLKDNFHKDLTEQEIKAVDYQTQAVGPNQPSTSTAQSSSRGKTTVIIIKTAQ